MAVVLEAVVKVEVEVEVEVEHTCQRTEYSPIFNTTLVNEGIPNVGNRVKIIQNANCASSM